LWFVKNNLSLYNEIFVIMIKIRITLLIIISINFHFISFGQVYTTMENGNPDPWTSVSTYPKHEIRAVWLTTVKSLDWPRVKSVDEESMEKQKAELCNILDKLQNANINTVVLQTRVRGSVIYPSSIEPWDECLTGTPCKDPGYDPLQFAISECHKRGMELHCWIVCIPLGDLKKQKGFGKNSITERYPYMCRKTSNDWFMRPDHPETGDYIASICHEITARYDIDGISLDYIRYPERSYNYKDDCTPAQRRDNITSIVRKIHAAVKPLKPWVKLSSSPIGKFRDLSRYSSKGWNSYDAVFQDAQGWLRDNLQDVLFPMMYFRGESFFPFLYDWLEHSYGHAIAPGLGIYFLDPSEGNWTLNDVWSEMHASRNCGIGGLVFFRSDFFTRNNQGLYTRTCKEFYPTPCLSSRMTWSQDTISPTKPNELYHDVDGHCLYWIGSDERGPRDVSVDSDHDYVYYNIYGSNTYPVDTKSSKDLLKTMVRGTYLPLTGSLSGYRYYAMTSYDRFGNESEGTQEYLMEIKHDLRDVWNPRSRMTSSNERVDDRKQAPSSESPIPPIPTSKSRRKR